MSSKLLMWQLLLAIAILFTHWNTHVAAETTSQQPNILVILIDDMGYSDLQAFGSPNASTPHINKLVQDGMKFTQWISAASICTPSRAALQTGRYPIRTGCMGANEQHRVIPTPSSPHGLDPEQHISIAAALKTANYRTGISGKWHLGINGNGMSEEPDYQFTPNSHGYDTYLGAPWTNAPMCAMDSDGISQVYASSSNFCFMTANNSVVQMPLHLENFTQAITKHAIDFFEASAASAEQHPWFFFMSYFHVHTPLFTNRGNKGRSRGGQFGDNVEEMDDSVGEIMETLSRLSMDKNTLIFLTSDNGPYQEEGWEYSGRTNVYDKEGNLRGRLKGGKGQLYEGGVRMPGVVVWPGVIQPGVVTDTMVSTMDIFPTALSVAGVNLGQDYVIDGKDMSPILLGSTNECQHDVFLHYCGFEIIAARVWGRWKVFWAIQKWYTYDQRNDTICTQCCNGINPLSVRYAPATELCGCERKDLIWLPHDESIVFDMSVDELELNPLGPDNWPADTDTTYEDIMFAANVAKQQLIDEVDPKPTIWGAGNCTAGLPNPARQSCCQGCHQPTLFFKNCNQGRVIRILTIYKL